MTPGERKVLEAARAVARSPLVGSNGREGSAVVDALVEAVGALDVEQLPGVYVATEAMTTTAIEDPARLPSEPLALAIVHLDRAAEAFAEGSRELLIGTGAMTIAAKMIERHRPPPDPNTVRRAMTSAAASVMHAPDTLRRVVMGEIRNYLEKSGEGRVLKVATEAAERAHVARMARWGLGR